MTLYDWLLLGHILSAMVWVGGGLMLLFVARRARASTDPHAILDFGESLSYIGPRLLATSVVGVLLFGVWMVLDSAAWEFGQAWILIAIGLFGVAFLIGAVYLSRVALQMVRSDGADARRSRALLDRWLLGYAAVLVSWSSSRPTWSSNRACRAPAWRTGFRPMSTGRHEVRRTSRINGTAR